MGKKRRMNASQTKFGGKHAHHPRLRLLLEEIENITATIKEITEPIVEPIEDIPEISEIPEIVSPRPKRPTLRKKTTKRTTKKSIT